MFENITAAPADPILGLADTFRQDPRENKINLGIGVYKDETGKTPVLNCVKKAEKYLLENETTKNYLPITGIPAFGTVTQVLLFGADSEIVTSKRARTAQAPGGTGALRIAADFIAKQTSAKRVWISNPTWPNHNGIFANAGLEICTYNYYDAENHALNFDGMLASLESAQPGDVILLHGCCHNPTGIDPTAEQWAQLSVIVKEKGLLPVFDFAYQALLPVWMKMHRGCGFLPNRILKCWLPVLILKTSACTMSVSGPAHWWQQVVRLLIPPSAR